MTTDHPRGKTLMSFDEQEDAYADLTEPISSWNWDGGEAFVRGSVIVGEPMRILSKQHTRALAHFEAFANAVIGIVLAQLVLMAFGVPLHEAMALNVVMFGVSYARSFVLRAAFARWGR